MNKILVKTIILFLLFGITSCSYKPIFLEKNYDFQITEIFLVGDKDINRNIQNKLKFIKNNDSKNKKSYTININSTKNREIVSKDSKGDPVKFELIILVEYKIISKNNILLDNKIESKNIYNNDSDQFKLEQTEDIILQNLSESIGDNIISSIINLDDN
tara:strand:+ start:303 stop:779 length:477 start_codon:yes stop_codon:yes gene_type:complete